MTQRSPSKTFASRLALAASVASVFAAAAPASAQVKDLLNQFRQEMKTEFNPAKPPNPEIAEAKRLKIQKEFELVSGLIAPTYQIAGAYRSFRSGRNEAVVPRVGDDLISKTSRHFAFGDFNGDGTTDLAVAVELPPPTDAPSWQSLYGDRSLQIYLGDQNGVLTLFREGTKIILKADEGGGGGGGDPLKAIDFNATTKTLNVSHFGGISSMWSSDIKLQLLGGEVVMTSRSDGRGDGFNFSEQVDINFVTGEKKTTKHNEREKTKESVNETEEIKPLQLLSEIDSNSKS